MNGPLGQDLAGPGATCDRGDGPSMAGLVGVATVLAIPYVLFTAFSGLSWFDDEGTLLIGFRSLREGHRMYDEIYSLYGPLYNGVYGLLYAVLQVPLTHTAARSIAAVLWLGYTAGFAWVCFRMTGSKAAALLGYPLILFWLAQLMDSPGHPEELTLVLLAILLLTVHALARRPTRHLAAAAGGLVAGVALIKLNVGVFAGGCLLLVMLRHTKSSPPIRAAAWVAGGGLLLLPVGLSALLLHLAWVRHYAAFATLTIGAALIVLSGQPRSALLGPAHALAADAGGLVVAAAIVGGMAAAGSSPAAMLDAVVLQGGSFIRNWYVPIEINWSGALAAPLAVSAALLFRFGGRWVRDDRLIGGCVLAAKAGFVLLAADKFFETQNEFRGLVPFCWLLMVCPAGTPAATATLREFAGLLGAVLSLYPFPVAGHQLAIGALLPIMAVPVLAHDLALAVRSRRVGEFAAGRGGLMLAAGAGTTLLLAGAVRAGQTYRSDTALGLPGTAGVHLPEQQAATLRWVTAQLARCGGSYWLPGLPSFALWTGHALPTSMNVNHVLGFIRPSRQDEIVQALRQVPDLCLVYNAKLLQFLDRGQIATNPPLLRYVRQDFVDVARSGDYAILKRRGALR